MRLTVKKTTRKGDASIAPPPSATPTRQRINPRYKQFVVVYEYGSSQHEVYFTSLHGELGADKRADSLSQSGIASTTYHKVWNEEEQAFFYEVYAQHEV